MLGIGYDIGSSSIKAAIVNLETGETMATAQHPETEMTITAHKENWAEQDPELWWNSVCLATKKLLDQNSKLKGNIKSIGIAYQMHGLVMVDKNGKSLRPAIIWCDSRTTDLGNQLSHQLGTGYCFSHLLNEPGNFTATKLKWVQENEADIYEKTCSIMLPGDYIAMRLTGEINTTISGLSEGTLWDFQNHSIAYTLLKELKISSELIPNVVDTFSNQGAVNQEGAKATGLPIGIPVTYRAGDQPNNALSLGVFEPGEVAATGGTSGVVYGVTEKVLNVPNSGVNSFAHVNHSAEKPRIGQLLCINGAGSQYAWIRNQLIGPQTSYIEMEKMIQSVPIGSNGLRIIPFGNGAERMIQNKQTGGQINNLQFNIHKKTHIIRAALEGIAFSFVYGIGALAKLGLDLKNIKVGNDNLFQSEIFATTISNLVNCEIQMQDTSGARGAALASGISIGAFNSTLDAFSQNKIIKTYRPIESIKQYEVAYGTWKNDLDKLIN